MGIKFVILVTLYLEATAMARPPHEPQVREILDEQSPRQYVRLPRHLPNQLNFAQLNYRPLAQRDVLKTRYHQQQQADARNLKPFNSPRGRAFVNNNNNNNNNKNDDWKPFQPTFRQATAKTTRQYDLDLAGSEAVEERQPSHQQQPQQFVLVTPGAPALSSTEAPIATPDAHQLTELQDLLGQSPTIQLEGLQKLLENSQTAGGQTVQIRHNGSPSASPDLEALQKQIDAVNRAQEEQILAAAQKAAEAQLKAQHEAIALAQKKAEEEAYAKIAAHNQGLSAGGLDQATPVPDGEEPKHEENRLDALERDALQEQRQPVDAIDQYAYAKPEKTAKYYLPASAQYVAPSEASSLYKSGDVQTYSPVSPYTPRPFKIATVAPAVATLDHETYQQVSFTHSSDDAQKSPLYVNKEDTASDHADDDDHHQYYAAKYSFGYRVLDEQHGNDFGHAEERDGKLTKGHYFVRLPDGRKQNVQYYADKNGYHARVSYEQGVAHHPTYVPQEHVEEDTSSDDHK